MEASAAGEGTAGGECMGSVLEASGAAGISPEEAPGTIASGGRDGRPRVFASAGGLEERGRSSLGSMMGGCSDDGGGLDGESLIARMTASSREDGDA
jgi:hypothetical protein